MFHVLLVEDQPDLSRVLARILNANGFETLVASSCAQAQGLDRVVDCAVFDIDLPDGSGVALAAELQSRGQLRSVVFFSAQADPEIRRAAERLGAFVSKSADVDELLRVMRVSIERARTIAALGSGTFTAARSLGIKRRCS